MNPPTDQQQTSTSPIPFYKLHALNLWNPLTIVEFLVFYAPIILAMIVFITPTFKMEMTGIVYLALLIIVCLARSWMYSYRNIDPYKYDGDVCTMVKYSSFGNNSISIFVIAYTLAYICTPMFYNNSINYVVLSLLLFYLVLTISIFSYHKCIKNMGEMVTSLVTGLLMGVLIPVFFYLGNGSRYLFFNNLSSDKDVCSMPSKQTFKCNVYKNGQLIA